MNARLTITVVPPGARLLCIALLWTAFTAAVAQEPRAPAPAPEATTGDGKEKAPAGTPRRPPAAPAAPAPFTPSEKVGADTAVRFPVDI